METSEESRESKMSAPFQQTQSRGRRLLQDISSSECVLKLKYESIYYLDAPYFVSNITVEPGRGGEMTTVSPWYLGLTLANGSLLYNEDRLLKTQTSIKIANISDPNKPVFNSSGGELPVAVSFVEEHPPPKGRRLPGPPVDVIFNQLACQNEVDESKSSIACEFEDEKCQKSWEYCCNPFNCLLTDSEALILPEDWAYPQVLEDIDPDYQCKTTNNTGWIVGVACGVSALVVLVVGAWYWRRRHLLYLKSLEDEQEEEEVPEDVHDLPWYVSIHKRLGTAVPPKKGPENESKDWVLSSIDKWSLASLSSDDRQILNGVRDIHIQGYSGVESLDGERMKLARSSSFSWPSTSVSTESGSSSNSRSTVSNLSRSSSWDGKMSIGIGEDVIGAARKFSKMRAGASGSSQGLGTGDSAVSGQGSTGKSTGSNKFMPASGILDGVDLHIPSKTIESNLGKCLGEGSFGAVYKAKYKGRDVAVKKVGIGKSMTRDQLLVEIGLAARFDSDRLVKIHGASLDNRECAYIVMELLTGGDLDSRIHGRKLRRMTYIEVLQAAQDIAEGLSFLHPLVIHRDLKVCTW